MQSETLAVPLRARLEATYARFEGPISSISLLGGFAFDAVTLKRADSFWEIFWVVVHLLIAAACIIFINRPAQGISTSQENDNSHFWFINTLQFVFGGLLSTFLVLNFRSGSIWVSWPFFLILAAAFIANERLKNQYERLYFQLSLFFLSLFCFTILIIPVIVHAIGPFVFLISGAVSLALLYLFLRTLRSFTGVDLDAGRRPLIATIGGVFLAMNALYFLNLIPPIPLSLRDAGVYHAITRNPGGNYSVQAESPSLFRFFRRNETFHASADTPVYAYSAIFSPTSLNATIVHQWQFYEPKRGWTNMSRVELPVRGGRGEGYRTYSVKTGILQGAWRVNVETPSGALLGRLRFNVIVQRSEPSLITESKN